MSQGKEWTTEEKNTIIQSLQPYLELGFSRNRACAIIGLAPSTLSNWLKDDEALGMKIQSYENAMNKLALENIRTALIKEREENKAETAKWYAERKMKDEFSTKTEQEIDHKGLNVKILNYGDNDSSQVQSS